MVSTSSSSPRTGVLRRADANSGVTTSPSRAARSGSTRGRLASRGLVVLAAAQLSAGFLNVILLAPVWMQLVHLLLADLIWIAFVLTGASVLSARLAEVDGARGTAPARA